MTASLFRLLYSLYERRLLRHVGQGPLAAHVGVILDGNGRCALKHGLTAPEAIYRLGAHKLDDLLDWCGELKVPAVTLSVFSTAPHIHRQRVRVRATGKLELLPPSTLAAIRAAEQTTVNYDAMVLTIAAAYVGREEIADAVRALVQDKAAQGERTPTDCERDYRAGNAGVISIQPICRIPTSLSERAAMSFPVSCCGRAPTASFTSPMSIGRLFANRFPARLRAYQKRKCRLGGKIIKMTRAVYGAEHGIIELGSQGRLGSRLTVGLSCHR